MTDAEIARLLDRQLADPAPEQLAASILAAIDRREREHGRFFAAAAVAGASASAAVGAAALSNLTANLPGLPPASIMIAVGLTAAIAAGSFIAGLSVLQPADA